MRYKIECFFYPTFYVYSKSALFDFLDCLKKYKNFALTDKFQISYSHGYFVRDIGYKYYKSDELEYHREFVREYVNDLYIIKDESNFVLETNTINGEPPTDCNPIQLLQLVVANTSLIPSLLIEDKNL